MEAMFSVKASELDSELFEQLKSFTKDDNDEITIIINTGKDAVSFVENKEDFIRRIQSRIDEFHSLKEYSKEEESSLNVFNEPKP
jgi:hypothetical protein